MKLGRARELGARLSLGLVLLCGSCAGPGLVTKAGAHRISVTSATKARHGWITNESLEERDGVATYKFQSARYEESADDVTRVTIKGEELNVNGKKYGKLNRGDSITVDGDKVLVNGREVREVTGSDT